MDDGDEKFMNDVQTDEDNPNDPANIKGVVSYYTQHGGNGQTGTIYVVAVTNINSWSTNISDNVAVTGDYQVIQVPHGDYYVKAWRDSDADGVHDIYEATGIYSSVAMTVSNQVTGINLTMIDPDTDNDGMGDWWEVEYFLNLFQAPSPDYDQDKLMNLAEYLAGTDPTAGFADADGDGMSDDWEEANGLAENDASDAGEDPDHDGFTNLEEFENNGGAATDPNDALSHPTGAIYVDDVNGDDTNGDGSYTNAYKTLYTGLNNVNDNGRVAVFPGTYTGAGNRGNVIYDTNVVLVGLYGAADTVVDCEETANAFTVLNSAVIRSLTIKNGLYNGGGAILGYGTWLSVESCVFQDNNSDSSNDGGAVNCSGILSVRDSTFIGNSSGRNGGVIYSTGDLVINNSCFSDNSAVSGGAVYFSGGELSISNSIFSGNVATNGGALYASLSKDATAPIVGGCTFTNNTALDSGGGIYLAPGNHTVAVRNSLIAGNFANNNGGGIYISSSSSATVIESCTIVDNHATQYVGGIFFYNDVTVRNCVLWDNQPELFFPFAPQGNITYNCIESWTNGGVGNITNNPVFVDATNGNYNIDNISPCYNAGTNQSWMIGATDIGDQNRICKGTVDMGCNELNLFLVSADNPNAATPYNSWATAAANIQDAIDVATGIDPVVLVTNGFYTNITTIVDSGVPNRVVITNDILVLSVNGANNTFIVGEGPVGTNAVRCAYVGSNACIRGFTLTNGFTFAFSFTSTNSRGGGAWMETGGIIENCTVSDCEASFAGGGVYGGIVKQCSIRDNEASFGGGLCDSFAERSIIFGNSASSGGGVATWNSATSISRSCLIVSNTATGGGGVYNSIIDNCTVADNASTNSGGGVYYAVVSNSIVYFNSPDNWYNGSLDYSCTTPMPAIGVGNIITWPGFINASNGNYRLVANSACLDRGKDELWMLSSKDLDGLPRIQSYQVDMGCYEIDGGYNYSSDIIRPEIGTNYLEISDDGYTHTGPNERHNENGYVPNYPAKATNLGFTINYLGTEYTNTFVNNNGNMTFGKELSAYIPQLLDSGAATLATFWADIDSRNIPNVIDGPFLYGASFLYGYSCFGTTWTNAGYFNTKGDKTNDCQVVLIDRSEIAVGDFDLEYNYRKIQWETGDASSGQNGFGGKSARVGFGDGNGFGFELPGSGIPGSFLSGGENDLTNNSLNSIIKGRYVFHFRDGWPFEILYEATMTNDPSWSLSGDWAYGVPAGQAGDPSSGYKGESSVIGYNLNGAYSNNISEISATINSIDCSGAANNVFLSFRRWLTIKTNDFASIEVSSDGNEWHEVWGSHTNAYTDTEWKHNMLDISPVAAGHNNVSIRWIMGTTDGQDVAGGWNLDEVRVLYVW